jgi:phosphoglycolate phosphatase-like HAD superfamily hydrolase
LIPVFVPWWKRKVIEEPLKAYRQFVFRKDYLHQVKSFPKVRELSEHLKEKGITMSLASSAHKSELDVYKRIANIEHLVEESSSADDAKRSKAPPRYLRSNFEETWPVPEEVLALGDTPYDAEAAGKASILTVGVTTGGWSEKELLHAGCIEVYKDVEDLLANFEQSALYKL